MHGVIRMVEGVRLEVADAASVQYGYGQGTRCNKKTGRVR